VPFPGALVLRAPAVALCLAAHLPAGIPYRALSEPTSWLVIGPWSMLAGTMVLFAADSVARRCRAARGRRIILAVGGAVAPWDVVLFGHPELAVAAAYADRTDRTTYADRTVRSAIPAGVVLVGPVLANAHRTIHAIVDRPSFPTVDHPTPWITLAPHLSPTVVATGPLRLASVAAAMAVGIAAGRNSAGDARRLCWAMTVWFACWTMFEPVMVAYYVAPLVLAALLATAVLAPETPRSWIRLAGAVAAAAVLAWFSLRHLAGHWSWWLVAVALTAVLLALAWPGRQVSGWRRCRPAARISGRSGPGAEPTVRARQAPPV